MPVSKLESRRLDRSETRSKDRIQFTRHGIWDVCHQASSWPAFMMFLALCVSSCRDSSNSEADERHQAPKLRFGVSKERMRHT